MKTAVETPPTNDPIPVRFGKGDRRILTEMKNATGLAIADIVRRAVRFAVPRFLSGEVSPLEVVEPPAEQPETV